MCAAIMIIIIIIIPTSLPLTLILLQENNTLHGLTHRSSQTLYDVKYEAPFYRWGRDEEWKSWRFKFRESKSRAFFLSYIVMQTTLKWNSFERTHGLSPCVLEAAWVGEDGKRKCIIALEAKGQKEEERSSSRIVQRHQLGPGLSNSLWYKSWPWWGHFLWNEDSGNQMQCVKTHTS